MVVCILASFLFMSACSIREERIPNTNACSVLEPCVSSTDEENDLANNGVIQTITTKDFYDRINSNEINIVFIGRDACKWCNKVRGIITDNTSIHLIAYYIDIGSIREDEREEFINTLCDLTDLDINEIGVPLLIRTREGICLEMLNGIPEYSAASEELENIWLNNIIVKFFSERSS